MNDFIKQQKAKILATYCITSIQKSQNDELEKGGKHGMIGEIRTWNGKKYKKQPNGKWLEVSRHGLTKKEHTDFADKHYKNYLKAKRNDEHEETILESKQEWQQHKKEADKLDDKEYNDTHVLGSNGASGKDTFMTSENRERNPNDNSRKNAEIARKNVEKELKQLDLSELKEEIFEWLGSGQGNQIPTHKVKELVKDLSEKELKQVGDSVQEQINDTDPESWDRDTIDDLESIFNRTFNWEDPYENE